MNEIVAGLGLTALALGIGYPLFRRRNCPKIVVGLFALAGAGLVGSWFNTFAVSVAGWIPGPVLVFVALVATVGVFADVFGKTNQVGRSTQIIALFVPLLLVMAPMSLFGVDPGQLIRDIKSSSSSITASVSN